MFMSQFIYAKSWELSYLLSGTCGLFVREGHQDVRLPMVSIIISSLKGVTSNQRDNTATIDSYHLVFFELDACIKLSNTRIRIKLI